MTVRLAPGTSELQVVKYLRAVETDRTQRRVVLDVLTERFALSFDDARLAMDRVGGGRVRATSGNPANEPEPAKDPLAWIAYRLELGLPCETDAPWPSPEQRAAADELLTWAREENSTRGTEDVAVAIEVVRQAVASRESAPTRYRLLLEAATAVSVAAEARIDRLGTWPCAPEGSLEWVDGVVLAAAARRVTACFAAQPDPELEERGLALVGRIVTRLLGQCHAFVGRAMLESARCIQRNGDPARAADHAAAVLSDFTVLLDRSEIGPPYDEDVIALEYLLAAIDLTIEIKGHTVEVDDLRRRTIEVLATALDE